MCKSVKHTRRNANFIKHSLHRPAARPIRDWQIRESLISDGRITGEKRITGRIYTGMLIVCVYVTWKEIKNIVTSFYRFSATWIQLELVASSQV